MKLKKVRLIFPFPMFFFNYIKNVKIFKKIKNEVEN